MAQAEAGNAARRLLQNNGGQTVFHGTDGNIRDPSTSLANRTPDEHEARQHHTTGTTPYVGRVEQ